MKVQLSDGSFALIDPVDADAIMKKTWHRDNQYAVHTTSKNGKPVSIYMHRLIANPPPGYYVDHKNGNGLDNRRGNLRIATHSQNMINSKVRIDSSSGFRGVSWDSYTKKWRARLQMIGNRRSIGRFTKKEDAVAAYVKVTNEIFGEFDYTKSRASSLPHED